MCFFKKFEIYIKIKAHVCRIIILACGLFILTSCIENEFEYRRNGIGANLYSSDLKLATKNLETYFGFICKQANIGTIGGIRNGEYPECIYDNMDEKNWTIFVQTGFNDIDRRCDGYLAWIEELRNREVFGSSQLNSIDALVRTIKVASGNSSTTSLAIVGAAFGYARDLFSDYHVFLYNGLESSTIKTIVLERRLEFRSALQNQQIKYKPDAVSLLRSYLRICMPYTITMDANTYARALVTGAVPANFDSGQSIKRTLISKNALTPQQNFGSRSPRQSFEQDKDLNQIFKEPNAYTRDNLILVQKALCLQPYKVGTVGPKTRQSIKLFEQELYKTLKQSNINIDGKISSQELTLLEDETECNSELHKNYWERKNLTTQTQVDSFIRRINAGIGSDIIPIGSSASSSVFRQGVIKARQKFKTEISQYESAEGPDGFLKNQVTLALLSVLR